jgi:HK97 gp10 family phage protein
MPVKRVVLKGLEKEVIASMKGKIKKAAEVLQQRMVENASLTDHSLKQLEKLGYPYAVNHPDNPHVPPHQVHKQSGKLVDNIKIKETPGGYSIGVSESDVPYVKWVIGGTKYMIARPFVEGSYQEVKLEIGKLMADGLKEGVDKA